MTESISDLIDRGYQLLNEGKEEALIQLITNLEKQNDLNPKDKHYFQFLKGIYYMASWRIEDLLRIAEQIYKESENPLYSFDALYLKFWAYWNQKLILRHRRDDLWRVVDDCEKLLKLAFQEPLSEIEPRNALYYYMKGHLYTTQRDNDQALENYKKTLAILEHHEKYSFLIPPLLTGMGSVYVDKGEIELALKYHKRNFELTKGNYKIYKITNGFSFRNIGQIYYQQGKLDLAVECLEKSLEIHESFKSFLIKSEVGLIYDNLIRIALDKDSVAKAQEYLDRFEKLIEKNKLPKEFWAFILSKARILKSSSRIRNRAEAEKLLIELIDRYDAAKKSVNRSIGEEWTPTLIELCDFYIEELRLTNDLKILDDIQPLVSRLLKESERTNSYSLQAQTYLLQGKISLITFKIKEARRFLTQAERIAERHGLVQLVTEISSLHEDIMQQLKIWDDLEEINAPVSKRMELAHLGKDFVKSIRSRLIKVAQVSEKSITVYKEQKKCLVCKGNIEGFNNYICSSCDSVYCEHCARALIDIDNTCWMCESPIDKSKPVKSLKQEGEFTNTKREKVKK